MHTASIHRRIVSLVGRLRHGVEFIDRSRKCIALNPIFLPVCTHQSECNKGRLMDILFILIPLSVLMALCILGGVWWAIYHGQFEDIEDEGRRILEDDIKPK